MYISISISISTSKVPWSLPPPPEALEYVDEAISHTPTLVELYACKARIFKHVRGAQGPWDGGWADGL